MWSPIFHHEKKKWIATFLQLLFPPNSEFISHNSELFLWIPTKLKKNFLLHNLDFCEFISQFRLLNSQLHINVLQWYNISQFCL